MQSPDEPRDSLSSSANDTPRAPVVRHRLAALPPARFTALSPRSDLGRPGPLSPVARDAGFGEGSELTQESKAPHWHPPRCGRRGGRGWRLSPSDPAAEEGRVPRDRRRVRQPSESGAPTSPAPAEGRGREIPSRVQNGGQEKRVGGPLSARAWVTDSLTLGTSRAQSLGEMAERAPPPPASQKNGR